MAPHPHCGVHCCRHASQCKTHLGPACQGCGGSTSLAHSSGETRTTFLPQNIILSGKNCKNLKAQQPHRCAGIFVSCFLPAEQRQALPCVVPRISVCALALHPGAGPGACQFYPARAWRAVPCCPPLGDTCGKCMLLALTPPFQQHPVGATISPTSTSRREHLLGTEQGKPCGTPEGDIHRKHSVSGAVCFIGCNLQFENSQGNPAVCLDSSAILPFPLQSLTPEISASLSTG